MCIRDRFIDIAEAADEIGDRENADVYNEKSIGNCDQNEFSQNKDVYKRQVKTR